MVFPVHRLRRTRRTPQLRRLVRETRLCKDDFILPVFVQDGLKGRVEIPSLPGVFRYGLDGLLREAVFARKAGLCALLLFGIPKRKDPHGKEAWKKSGIIPRAVRLLKKEIPDMVVITDVCACEYTSHGHCGILKNRFVDNDATLKVLSKTAVAYAEAGADMVAPSDMMDGRVGAIRRALDRAGLLQTPIVSYAAKMASVFYGPFREAAGSAPIFGDRKSYQMDFANAREALREMEEDLQEGADILLVKPGLLNLDILSSARRRFLVPLWAYHVSGEYAALKAAGRLGWLDAPAALMESLTALKRAGADRIITYFAKEAASRCP